MARQINFGTVSWPSLYNPAIDLFKIRDPVQPGGHYLVDPKDIFRFTLYWTLIFHIPFYAICGTYAFLNFAFPPPSRRSIITIKTLSTAETSSPHQHQHQHQHQHHQHHQHQHQHQHHQHIYIHPTPTPSPSPDPNHNHHAEQWIKRPRPNIRRSRLTFALLVILVFLFLSVAGAVMGAAVVGFALAGVYKAGGFYMSTWTPFVWAVIQSLVGLLAIWPSVIDII